MKRSAAIILYAIASYLGCGIVICTLIIIKYARNPFSDEYGSFLPWLSWIFLTITAIPCALIGILLFKRYSEILITGFMNGALLIGIFLLFIFSVRHIMPSSILSYTDLIPPLLLIVLTGIIASGISFVISLFCVKVGSRYYYD